MRYFLLITLLFSTIYANNDFNLSKENNISISTPFNNYLVEKYKKKGNTYNKYISFFLLNKANGNVALISKLLNSRDKYLGFYEGLIKSLYYQKIGESEKSILLADTVYNKGLKKLTNSTTGVFLQDLYLHYGLIDKANTLVIEDSFCYSLGDKDIREGCILNNLWLKCISKDIEEEEALNLLLNKQASLYIDILEKCNFFN